MNSKNSKQTWTRINGRIKKGYGIASGQAIDSPFPKGSIEMQAPYFLAEGLDISHCFMGTLNVTIDPLKFKILKPEWTFKGINWFKDLIETFSFSTCIVLFNYIETTGFTYYPHPETKPDHFHSDSTIEIISPFIPELFEHSKIELLLNPNELELIHRD